MKTYKKHIRFFLVLFLFTLIVTGVRFYWINKAFPSKATVLYIDRSYQSFPSGPMQYYPVVSYRTHRGEVVARGTSNLPINTGERVDILYNPDDPQEFKLNTSYWLWYDIWSWYRLIWIAIALYYLVLFIVQRSLTPAARPLAKNGNSRELLIAKDYSGSDPVPAVTGRVNPVPFAKGAKRLPGGVKVMLLLLLAVSAFLIGQIWNLSYAWQIAVVIVMGLVALGSPYGPANDGDI